MSDTNDALTDQLAALVESMALIAAGQARLESALAANDRSARAIATVLGMTFLATESQSALPADALNDPVFARFLQDYPIDGPPIVGITEMQQLLRQLTNLDAARLSAEFAALHKDKSIDAVKRVRNLQLEFVLQRAASPER